MSAAGGADGYAAARPVWGEVDLGAIAANLELIRARAGRPVRILAPIKADAYGHGAVPIARHLAALGVDGLATANLDDAVAVRAAGVSLPILLYASALPEGLGHVVAHGLTPTVVDANGVRALADLAAGRAEPLPVHVKVDAGLGRLGVRLDEAAALARMIDAAPGLDLEGIYTHLPFATGDDAAWSARRLEAFAAAVRAIEAERGRHVRFAQGAASSLLAAGIPDGLSTIAPGHLVFGLSPIAEVDAAGLGFAPALRAVRARLIHIGERRRGDDLAGAGPGGLAGDGRVGVVLFGMDNGYRPAASPGGAHMLCRGRRCPVLGVSAEYATIDLAGLPDAAVGDAVTVIGTDGDERIRVEDVAAQLGAPSAAYWLVALRGVPLRYV